MTTSRSRRLGTTIAIVLIAATLAARATEEIIPSERCHGLWFVPISFGDEPERTLVFVLDTGASHTSVDPDSVERLTGRYVKPGKSVRLRGGVAGPLKIKKLKADVHDMDHLARGLGMPFDGILGFPTFKDYLLTLDYHASEIRLGSGSLPAVDGRTIFKDVGTVRPYLAVEVGGSKLPILVDSGSTSGLNLLVSDEVPWEVEPRPVSASIRYSKILLEKTGRLGEDVAYGPLTVKRPVVDVTEQKPRIAGEDLLQRFVWTFDQRARRIRMISDSGDPIESEPFRGSGLAYRPTDDGFEVVHIFPGTPGADGRIHKGDVLVEVDGKPVYDRGCEPILPREKDSTFATFLRDGETFSIELAIEVLVP
jgi:hypothetical protein